MRLVTRQIPALFNGVSQQPPTLRLPSQAEAVINAYPTVVDGVRKRPASEHIAKISAADYSSAHVHLINRDVTERYIVVVSDGDLKVYDTAGNEKTVSFPEGKAYLDIPAESTANESFALVSIADYSFVINKTVTVATKLAPTSTPTGFANWFAPTGWGPVTANEQLYYNAAQGTYRGVKQAFADLPNVTDPLPPAEGDVWKVAGSDSSGFGAFYVVRRNGVWEETCAPGGANSIGLDEATMPWALVRLSDGTFMFTKFPWKVRKVGDSDSNPPPTFVGKTLSDVFYYKNRLGFVCDENVVMSAAGDYGQFFRQTVTDLLDSDVVDVAVSTAKVSALRFAVPSNNALMLFADQSQFRMNAGSEGLTPNSVSIDTASEFEMNLYCRPVGIGTEVYFVTEAGQNSRIREYFVDPEALSNDANDVTAHVPRFLPKNIRKLAGNANEDVLFALSADEPSHVYVYKFFWNNDGKAQSAWVEWRFSAEGTILSMEALENNLYLVVQRYDGVHIERVNVANAAVTGDLDYPVLLDRLVAVPAGVYSAVTNKTTWTLPYLVAEADRASYRLVRGSAFTGEELSLVDPSTYEWTQPDVLTATGDHSDGVVYGGLKYEMRYTFSEQFLETQQGAITTGRLMLRTFVVYFQDTAFFKTEVAPYGNDPLVESVVPSAESEFTGKTLGEASLLTNTPIFATGKYAFQVYGDSRVAKVTLVNDTHVQSKFVSAEVEMAYHNRARPLG
jgi:hypothetical protein